MTTHPASTHRGVRLFALCAVTLGLLLLAAAAFVLSYAGVHAVALAAGVSPRLARIYPVILDAMVVVAGAAVLSLRGAGLPSRWYAWLSLLVMLAADGGADTVHAVGTRLPHKQTAAAAAIIPWALVLIGFGLLLSMLRHARLRADTRRDKDRLPELTEPGPGIDPDAYAQPDGEAEFRLENESLPEAGFRLENESPSDDELEAEDESMASNELEADDELGASRAGDEARAEDDVEAAAVPDAEPVGFERVHSTPLPPGG